MTRTSAVRLAGAVLLVVGFGLGWWWRAAEKGPAGADGAPAPPAEPHPGLHAQELETIRIFEEASPSVAFITTLTLRQDFFTWNVTEIPAGTGSGFVWDTEGHVITNFHVIQNADRARVTLADQSTWDATVVGTAPEKDLAVLLIEAPGERLHPIPLGTSEGLRVGQSVFAIGNPFGLDQTLTTGVISALDREIESVARIPIRGVIQTDAAINPGNSGGPLLDSAGRLIGVNTAIYSPSGASAGIGFSIPVDVVRWVIPQLLEFGHVRRPTLGVELASTGLTARLGIRGALVLQVSPGGGAAKAGIRPTRRDRRGQVLLGDVIVAIEGEPIAGPGDIILALERRQPGDTVRVTVMRDDDKMDMQVVLDRQR